MQATSSEQRNDTDFFFLCFQFDFNTWINLVEKIKVRIEGKLQHKKTLIEIKKKRYQKMILTRSNFYPN